MAIFDMLLWWYGNGWGVFINKIKSSLASLTDFFSMDSLVRTLFKPFRQISAESAGDNSALDTKFQMFIDRLVSRMVGFVSRLILLVVGIILIIIGGVVSLMLIIIWPLVPFLPIVGIILTVTGFML